MIAGLKRITKSVTPPILYDVLKRIVRRRSTSELSGNGVVPWSPAYAEYKREKISQALADGQLLERFRARKPLPEKYGYGLDERCVEYPWLFANLAPEAKLIMDAGSVLNFDFILTDQFLKGRTLHILTLAPEENCFWKRGISYLYDDLRAIPIRNGYYDVVVCLSTLEHVGCDNSRYGERDAADGISSGAVGATMRELRRVLKPSGSLFLTVPFGAYRDFGTFQQFDKPLLAAAVEQFGQTSARDVAFYRYTASGWQVATASDCVDCEFVEWVAQSWSQRKIPAVLPVEDDRAAAARAVACVHLKKS